MIKDSVTYPSLQIEYILRETKSFFGGTKYTIERRTFGNDNNVIHYTTRNISDAQKEFKACINLNAGWQ
jgi:hypothetical protein